MLRIEKTIDNICLDDYVLSSLNDPESVLFFDIETTGLSCSNSQLYLIGCMYRIVGDNSWHLIQLFAESLKDEVDMVKEFAAFCANFDLLISFNGAAFDINYLCDVASQYHLETEVEALRGISSRHYDMYQRFRTLKKVYSLPGVRLKNMEELAGIARKDIYNGYQLISFYEQYLVENDPQKGRSLFHNLLLHNEEDILNLLPLMNLLFPSVSLFGLDKRGTDDVLLRQIQIDSFSYTEEEQTLTLDGHFPFRISKNLAYHTTYAESCSLIEDSFHIRLRAYCGELKLFFPNYRDYYYLPMEDMSIHKSVADFVESSHKVRATAKTCYTKRTGIFFPQYASCAGFSPSFSFHDPKEPICYFEWTRENADCFRNKENELPRRWLIGLIRSFLDE